MELVRLLTELPASLPGERSPGWWLAGEGSKTLAFPCGLLLQSLDFNLVSTSPEFSHGTFSR